MWKLAHPQAAAVPQEGSADSREENRDGQHGAMAHRSISQEMDCAKRSSTLADTEQGAPVEHHSGQNTELCTVYFFSLPPLGSHQHPLRDKNDQNKSESYLGVSFHWIISETEPLHTQGIQLTLGTQSST